MSKRVLLAALCVFALCSTAMAENIRLDFFGVIDVSHVSGVNAGDGFRGHIDYDDTVINPNSSQATSCSPNCVALGGPVALTVEIGGGTVSIAGLSLAVADNMHFFTDPDGVFFDDFQLDYIMSEAFAFNAGGTLAGQTAATGVRFSALKITTHDTSFITDYYPPASLVPPTIPGGDHLAVNGFSFYFGQGLDTYVRGHLTATQEGYFPPAPTPDPPSTTVPEPSSFSLLATALAGLTLFGKSRFNR